MLSALTLFSLLPLTLAAPSQAPSRPIRRALFPNAYSSPDSYSNPKLHQRSGNGTNSCPPNFRNVVFNSAASSEPGWPNRFDFLQSHGISSWIGFTVDQNSAGDAALNNGQIRVVVTEDSISDAQSQVTSPNPPPYIEVLNEPDAAFYGQKVLSPQEAASAVQNLINTQTRTKFISPAPASPGSSWLPDFFNACSGCLDKVAAVAAHVYSADPQAAISKIQAVHSQFPNKKIWVTEVSPSSDPSQGCTLDANGVINWMNTVLGWAAGTGYVERVFWNAGEYGPIYKDDPTKCNPSLTNMDGSATALLESYEKLCA